MSADCRRCGASTLLIDDGILRRYDFKSRILRIYTPGMSVSVTRCIVCAILAMSVPVSLLGQTPSAILHTQGGVWLNGYEAHDATAVFTGDLLETKPGFSATLNLEGSTIVIQPESIATLQDNLLALDHGSVSVTTSKTFKVRTSCLTVVPVSNTWTQYDVTDVNGTVQVAARKSDVNVERENMHRKPTPESAASQQGSVHEGEQHSYNESDLCGAPARPTGAASILNPKWIGAGAAGTGVLLWLLLHGGGGQTPLSNSQP